MKNKDGCETVHVGLYASGGEHIRVCGPLPGSENYAMHCILYISIYYAHRLLPMAKNVWGVWGGSIGQSWWVNEYSQ